VGVERTGDVEQPHVEEWSTVMRVPTDEGPVWFKANHEPLRHEAALTLVAARAPTRVPTLMAFAPDSGWMLMRDGGRRLRERVEEERSLDRWHDDLHDGQVFLKDGRHLVMDWGDACISHPFFTLSVTLEGVLAWGLDDVENSVDTTPFRDAYLAPYRDRYDGDLDAACALAIRLGWACRAVNGHVPGENAATAARLGMFLEGSP
jgi:hypothetical protein